MYAQKIKVIAYNVEFAKNTTPQAMANLLEKEKSDIICFNEVPAQGWTKKVGALLKMPYSYEGKVASANHEKGFNDKTGQYYGKYKSILSKYPLKNTEEINLPGIGWSPATVVVADVEIKKSKTITVFSLHIPSGRSNASKSKAKRLSEIIKNKFSTDKPMILAGDFNDLTNSDPLNYLYEIGFKNPWKELNMKLDNRSTIPGDGNVVIDHILFRGLSVKKGEIIEEKENFQSDHKPVWAVFKL
jgi:endonuclease/exonuclease/phosphatase family metal-dependent hydrolase